MRLITYNIHRGMDMNNKDTVCEIIEFIKNVNSDVICLQEVLYSIHKDIIKKLNIYGCFLETVNLKNDKYGISTYFYNNDFNINKQYLESKKEQRGFIHLIFYYNKKLVNIINLHLGLDLLEREKQINQILKYCEKLRGKIIICGDFNEKSLSIDGYYDLSQVFNLENVETFPKSKSRIDYIFVSNNIKLEKYKVHFVNMSDHYPVEAKFTI